MGLDHSNAFVRLTFDGLIAFCYNRQGDCLMGMAQADDHRPLLEITKIYPNGSTVVMRRIDLQRDADVMIEAKDPVELGAHTFPLETYQTTFNRRSADADPEDFRWIIDMQGKDFHGSALRLKKDPSDPPSSRLRPRILIPHGIFYAHDKTPDEFTRFQKPRGIRSKRIGKIADRVGADIVCDPVGGRVDVTIGAADPIKLERHTLEEKGLRYRIDITNLCRADGSGPTCPPDESDFHHYYKALIDEDGVQFDLKNEMVAGDPRGTMDLAVFIEKTTGEVVSPTEFEGLRSNGPPQVCCAVFLGQTNKIP